MCFRLQIIGHRVELQCIHLGRRGESHAQRPIHKDHQLTRLFQSARYQDKKSNLDPNYTKESKDAEMSIGDTGTPEPFGQFIPPHQTHPSDNYTLGSSDESQHHNQMTVFNGHSSSKTTGLEIQVCRHLPRRSHRWVVHKLHHLNHLKRLHHQDEQTTPPHNNLNPGSTGSQLWQWGSTEPWYR